MSAVLVAIADDSRERRRRQARRWTIPLLAGLALAWPRDNETKHVRDPVKMLTSTTAGGKALPDAEPPPVQPAGGGVVGTETPLINPVIGPAKAVIAPDALDFGEQRPGATAPVQLVSIRNEGGLPLARASAKSAAPFVVTTSCARPLAPGGECVAAVLFAPQTPGRYTGTLKIAAGDVRRAVLLRGTLAAPPAEIVESPPPPPTPPQPGKTAMALCISPAEIHFWRPGKRTVTLRNPNPTPLSVATIATTGKNDTPAAGYTVTAALCLKTLAPGESCTFDVIARWGAIFTGERMRIEVMYDDAATGQRKTARVSDDCNRVN